MHIHLKMWGIISLLTIAISLIVIFWIGPVWGVDFAGGSLLEVRAPSESLVEIRFFMQQNLNLQATVQTTADETLIIRTETLTNARHREVIQGLTGAGLIKEELRFESVGPTIGAELRTKALIAVVLVVIVLIMYLAYEFRASSSLAAPWKVGVAASYALVHDLIFITALFVIFGKLWQVPIDSLFVTAQLAILGYSVNDTIVLFNRLQLNWRRRRNSTFSEVVDSTVRDTLMRSLNTAITTLIVLLALLLFGGTTIRWFIVALTAGAIVGTYSSIFAAPPALAWLAKKL